MKKVILAAVTLTALASGSANATVSTTTVCGGGAAGNGSVVNSATDNFVRVPFTPKCSANVHLSYEDGNTYFRVGSASAKGKSRFAGSTAGGAVVNAGSCTAATGCTSSDATTANGSSYAPTS